MTGAYERELAKPGHVAGEYMPEPKATTIPGPGTDDRPVVWRLWWRFGFGPIIRLINFVPVPEWRREA
jgi:hypothetical protein